MNGTQNSKRRQGLRASLGYLTKGFRRRWDLDVNDADRPATKPTRTASVLDACDGLMGESTFGLVKLLSQLEGTYEGDDDTAAYAAHLEATMTRDGLRSMLEGAILRYAAREGATHLIGERAARERVGA